MEIINDWPPNISEIKEILPVDDKAVYCYGNNIYVPDKHEVPPEIIFHESIHSKQQGDNPAEWWYKYLISPGFRLEQEIEAYAAQFAFVQKHTSAKRSEIELDEAAQALSGKEYGNMCNYHEARTFIRKQAQKYAL